MSQQSVEFAASATDEVYQELVLPGVSRTFALTIPQLPASLRTPVTSAYLLCRIADTIEDDPALSADSTLLWLQRFVAVVQGQEDAEALARELAPLLSATTLAAERALVANLPRVMRVVGRYSDVQRRAIQRCIEVMCGGMHHFQQTASLRGLARLSDLDDYCYFVAGVVGQMLTELFCAYSPAIAEQRGGLQALAVSFAQGLQMTNILKDLWEDRGRGACWLPQEVFSRHGIEVARLAPGSRDPRVDAAISELVGVAHAHLRNALAYTLLIPRRETGIRRFCLWAVGLAVLTLRKIERTPGFANGAEVKISHAAVGWTRVSTNLAVRSDALLRALFDRAARGLPLAPALGGRRAARAAQPVSELRGRIDPEIGSEPLERSSRHSEGRSAR